MNNNKPKAIIWDCDGTLCDVSGIRWMVDQNDPDFTGHEDFDGFHEASIDCPPHRRVVDAFHKANASGLVCIVVTARPERFRTLTRWWMTLNNIFPAQQLHRPEHDFRPDAQVKKDILDRLRQTYDVIEAWDDDPAIIQLWKDEGIDVEVVEGWPEWGTQGVGGADAAEEEVAGMSAITNSVAVTYGKGGPRYHFKNDVTGIEIGDLVVVKDRHGYSLVNVAEVHETPRPQAKAWVVDKVDTSREERRKARAKLETELRKAIAEEDLMVQAQRLAKTSGRVADLVASLNDLDDQSTTTS